jgi:CubicO group peptidase (beta-lactamase class C family)
MFAETLRRDARSWRRWLAVGLVAVTACSGDDDEATPPLSMAAPASIASVPPGSWQSLVDEAFDGSPGVPGISLAVLAPDDGVDVAVASGSGGLSPAQPFRISSNTKTFTAAATLRLVEDGVLGFDDPIGEHLSPTLVDAIDCDGYDTAAITVRHLLQHTSGCTTSRLTSTSRCRCSASRLGSGHGRSRSGWR